MFNKRLRQLVLQGVGESGSLNEAMEDEVPPGVGSDLRAVFRLALLPLDQPADVQLGDLQLLIVHNEEGSTTSAVVGVQPELPQSHVMHDAYLSIDVHLSGTQNFRNPRTCLGLSTDPRPAYVRFIASSHK